MFKTRVIPCEGSDDGKLERFNDSSEGIVVDGSADPGEEFGLSVGTSANVANAGPIVGESITANYNKTDFINIQKSEIEINSGI